MKKMSYKLTDFFPQYFIKEANFCDFWNTTTLLKQSLLIMDENTLFMVLSLPENVFIPNKGKGYSSRGGNMFLSPLSIIWIYSKKKEFSQEEQRTLQKLSPLIKMVKNL